ncbi:MAG: hypothetical protein HUJ73_00295, partial [Eubacterium sp.]|nr:hypothetical protein [Eubacterium sp.]
DEEGFGRIGDRYVIACRTSFGLPGDVVDFYLEDGQVIKTVVGDSKGSDKDPYERWGQAEGQNVIEFMVKGSVWYNGHVNPGNAGCHPEWGGRRVVQAVNYGSIL